MSVYPLWQKKNQVPEGSRMDEDTRKILRQWNLPDYIDVFKDNKIDVVTLNMLDQSMIKELIRPIGDRAKFLQNLDLWKNMSRSEDDLMTLPPLPDLPSEIDDEIMSVDVLSPKHRHEPTIAQLTKEADNKEVGQSPKHFPPPQQTEEADNKGQSSKHFPQPQQTKDTNHEILEDSTKDVNDIPSTSSTTSSATIYVELFSTEIRKPLLDLLNQSAEGKNILRNHEEGLLSNNSRRKICNIIIQSLLSTDHDVRVPHETLFWYAQEIKSLFPKENISTYFIPYINNNKMKIKTCAKGKLYDCLHNRKREYRCVENKNAQLKAKQAINDNKQSNENDENDENNDAVQQDITWLQNSTNPWQLVEAKWKNTVKMRLNSLNKSNKTIDQYMTEFPALKKPVGYNLLVEDFKALYPGKENSLHENFGLFKHKILDLAKQRAKRDVSVKTLITSLETPPEEDDVNAAEAKSIIAFEVLPLLLGNPLAKVKKSNWRPSKKETSEGFITHITTATDLHSTVSSRREKFSTLNVTMQPFIIIVGENCYKISKYYVVVNDTFYVLPSIETAVDVCFKIFHVLNCKYPIECSSTWQFIQIGLYDLKTSYDKQFISVNAFLTDLGIQI